MPCHNDLLASNFIDDGRNIWILDWEYAGMGDIFFDLGNFAVNQALDDQQCALLLRNYFGEVRPSDLAHLQLMRLASDLREAFWGFLQLAISELDFDYRAYADHHLERFLSNVATPRFSQWLQDVVAR
jgi:thiamine kinase-like enzyme